MISIPLSAATTFVLNEPDLIRELKQYFTSLIADKEAFIDSVLASLELKIPKTDTPAQTKRDIAQKRKKLLSKKDRYQEMYANDLITLPELKNKLPAILEELKAVDMDLEQIEQSARILNNAEQVIRRYTEEILRFLELDTVTNTNMHRVIDHISVNRDGNVRIVLKKFEDLEHT